MTRTNPASKGDLTEIYFLKKYAAMNPFKGFVPSVLIDSGTGQIYPRSMLGLPSVIYCGDKLRCGCPQPGVELTLLNIQNQLKSTSLI